jgi:hypothetical protein
MWIEPWTQEDWVISKRGASWLHRAFWGETALLLMVPFLVYVGRALLASAYPLSLYRLPQDFF